MGSGTARRSSLVAVLRAKRTARDRPRRQTADRQEEVDGMERTEFERLVRERVAQRGLTAIVEQAVAAHVMVPIEVADIGNVDAAVGRVTEKLGAITERKNMSRAERIAAARGWTRQGGTQ
jgi:hypothetical protein